MTDRVLTVTEDTFVNQNAQSAHYARERFLNLRDDTNQQRRALLKFGLPADLKGSTVVSATLAVYLKGSWTGANTVNPRRITTGWAETKVDWDNQPSVAAAEPAGANGTVTGGGDGDVLTFDLTEMITDVAGGDVWKGIRLQNTSNTQRQLYSRNAVNRDYWPTLTITYHPAPDAPRDLRPSGGAAVSEAAPMFLWNSEVPTFTQVLIDDDDNLTGAGALDSPIYDSTMTANTLEQWDTALDGSPPALSDNTTYYWQVRITDEAGVISDWSDVATFQRRSKGSLTIDAPTTGGTVTSTTPEISHTFTSRTQTFVSYELYEDGVLIWTRPKQVQLTDSLILPAGYIKNNTSTYQIDVKVWDQFSRASIDDDRDYVSASAEFTLVAGAPGAPTGLAVSTSGGHVHMAWSRSSAPDYFVVFRDGEIMFDELDPADLSVGGTAYEFEFFRGMPDVEHTYTVAAAVLTGGVFVIGPQSTPVDHTLHINGIWLADEVGYTEVFLGSQDSVSTKIGEGGGVLFPVNRRDPVRVVDSVRGYEGSASGLLLTYRDRDAEEWHDDWLILCQLALTGSLRLTWGKRNIPVTIVPTEDAQLPSPETMYAVGFEFYQVAEFPITGV